MELKYDVDTTDIHLNFSVDGREVFVLTVYDDIMVEPAGESCIKVYKLGDPHNWMHIWFTLNGVQMCWV